MSLLRDVASLVKSQPFGRAGLMCLAECVAAAAAVGKNQVRGCDEATDNGYSDKAVLLDVFRFIIDTSKQHFNPNYRLKGNSLHIYIYILSYSL